MSSGVFKHKVKLMVNDLVFFLCVSWVNAHLHERARRRRSKHPDKVQYSIKCFSEHIRRLVGRKGRFHLVKDGHNIY